MAHLGVGCQGEAIDKPIVSLLLWLCSEQLEIEGRGRPGNPRPVKTKRGERTPVLRWLHPVLVGGGDVDELPAVVRPVNR